VRKTRSLVSEDGSKANGTISVGLLFVCSFWILERFSETVFSTSNWKKEEYTRSEDNPSPSSLPVCFLLLYSKISSAAVLKGAEQMCEAVLGNRAVSLSWVTVRRPLRLWSWERE